MTHETGSDQDVKLNPRERATLRAVADGDAEISCSSEPDLFVQGLPCCDQATARRLARLGLIEPTRQGRRGERVPATVTGAGRGALGRVPAGVA